MNELTKRLVMETAKRYKRKALENGTDFKHYVQYAHVNWLIAEYGWKLKQRAVDLFRLWRPEFYDGEFIQDYHRIGFDLDVRLSDIAMRCLWRKVARNADLKLESWGDLPVRVARPQEKIIDAPRVKVEKKKTRAKKRDQAVGVQMGLDF